MLYVINSNNEKTVAEPGKKGMCQLCGEEVISKCGDINVWHWAHKKGTDCDTWSEGETQWHVEWKNKFPLNNREIIVQKQLTKHIADVMINEKYVVEFQNSPISSEDIKNREKFYDKMLWIFNGKTYAKNLILFKMNNNEYEFIWKYKSKVLQKVTKKTYFDLSELSKQYKEELIKLEKELENINNKERYNNTKNNLNKKIKELIEKIKLYDNNLFIIKNIYANNNCCGVGEIKSKNIVIKNILDMVDKNTDTKKIVKLKNDFFSEKEIQKIKETHGLNGDFK